MNKPASPMPADLPHLRTLLAAATKGPWTVRMTTAAIPLYLIEQTRVDEDPEHTRVLIEEMRRALPALLDELEASRRLVAEIRANQIRTSPWNEDIGDAMNRYDAAAGMGEGKP